jgi:thiamine pyridinylase
MRRFACFALAVWCGCQSLAQGQPAGGKAPTAARRPLKVVLYPFVPAKDELFYYVERTFKESPEGQGIDLQVIDLSANYYNPKKAASVEAAQADVYELDGVFADDFIAAKRIRALPADLRPAADAFLPSSLAVVTKGSDIYGIPHWLCGNFLFFRSGDAALPDAKTIDELGAALGKRGVFTDMKGSSSLGELYLDAEISSLGSFAAVLPHLSAAEVGKSDALIALRKLLSWCPAGYCRDDDYHYREGFYARQFSRGVAAAYIGYSESLFYVGEEAGQSCRHEDKCVDQGHVQVTGIPFAKAVHSVGWTDVLALDANCTGQCEADARAFLKFYDRESTTMALLLPKGLPPRYLLPGRKSLYASKDLLAKAPLYTQLWNLISKTEIVTSPALNGQLRSVGAELDDKKELPDH